VGHCQRRHHHTGPQWHTLVLQQWRYSLLLQLVEMLLLLLLLVAIWLLSLLLA
jgi:hypothetical protein